MLVGRAAGGGGNPVRMETSISTWKMLLETFLNETFFQNKFVKEIGGEERPFSRSTISADNLCAATGFMADLGEEGGTGNQGTEGILEGMSEFRSPSRDGYFG